MRCEGTASGSSPFQPGNLSESSMYFSAARLAVPRHVRAARSSSLRPRAIQDTLRQVFRGGQCWMHWRCLPRGLPGSQGVAQQACGATWRNLVKRRWQGASGRVCLLSSCHSCGSFDGSRSKHRSELAPSAQLIAFSVYETFRPAPNSRQHCHHYVLLAIGFELPLSINGDLPEP